MTNFGKLLSTIAASALLVFSLSACSGNNSSGQASANASSGAQSQASNGDNSSDDEAMRAQITQIIEQAANAEYGSVTFNVETKTSATSTSSVNGQQQQQTMTTTMTGEISKAGDAPSMHMRYQASSTQDPTRTEYDMYITPQERIVQQGEELYLDEMTQDDFNNYVKSITAATTFDEVNKLLELASECKKEEKDGETVISMTIDRNKLNESDLIDSTSLPEGTEIATLVASYSIDDQNRFKAVRLMSSTTGSPTYRVSQTYKFSNYDETTMPAWPDLEAYIAAHSY